MAKETICEVLVGNNFNKPGANTVSYSSLNKEQLYDLIDAMTERHKAILIYPHEREVQ